MRFPSAIVPALVDTGRLASTSLRRIARGDRAMPSARGLGGSILLMAVIGWIVAAAAPPPPNAPAAALGAVLAAGLVRHGVRPAAAAFRHGWTATLPVAAGTQFLLCRVLPWLVVTAVLSSASLALVPFAGWPAPTALGLAFGAAVGGAVAALWPLGEERTAWPGSRYRISGCRADGRASAAPLVLDLHAHVAERMRPASMAKVVAAMLLMLPSGMAPIDVAVGLPALAAAIYAAFLLGTLSSHASEWRDRLAATPADRDRLLTIARRAVRMRLAMAGAIAFPAVVAAAGLPLAAMSLVAVSALLELRVRQLLAPLGRAT